MSKDLQLEDFRLAFLALWKGKILLFVIALFGMFTGLFYQASFPKDNYFKGSSSVYCAIYNTTNQSTTLTTDITAAITNYTDVITSEKVAEYAASLVGEEDLTAEDIAQMISIEVNANSYVIQIFAYHSSPLIATEVANAVAQSFVSEMSTITDTNSVHILDTAKEATQMEGDSTLKQLLLFTFIPLFLMSSYIGLKSLLSDKVRSVVQCLDGEEQILGIVPMIE